jgi:hypothetical protein
VPVLIDAASELPPESVLTRYTTMGADLVVVSGGKGLEGPVLSGRSAAASMTSGLHQRPRDSAAESARLLREAMALGSAEGSSKIESQSGV